MGAGLRRLEGPSAVAGGRVTVQISTNPSQYLISQLQSLMGAQPFSGLAADLAAGQVLPGGSASSSGSNAAPTPSASTPSSQLSPDLLSSLIAAQAGSSSDANAGDPLSQLQGAGGHHHHHHHHGATQASQASQTNSSISSAGQTTAEADESDSGAEPVASAAPPATASS
jgi:hypothetical protein